MIERSKDVFLQSLIGENEPEIVRKLRRDLAADVPVCPYCGVHAAVTQTGAHSRTGYPNALENLGPGERGLGNVATRISWSTCRPGSGETLGYHFFLQGTGLILNVQ